MDHLPDYLEGAVDLHVHSAPDVDRRRFDDLELARAARDAGMGAVLIKSHQNSTVERAYLVSRSVPGIRVFGGLVLNETVGGLNPAAVELALKLGAKQIWMPTRSARNHRMHHGEAGGIGILDSQGVLLPEVEQIVLAVSNAGCILGTGHLSPEETAVLIAASQRLGAPKILVTHPEWNPLSIPRWHRRSLPASRMSSSSGASSPPLTFADVFRLKPSKEPSAQPEWSARLFPPILASRIRLPRPRACVSTLKACGKRLFQRRYSDDASNQSRAAARVN